MNVGDKVRLKVDLYQYPHRPNVLRGERLYSAGDELTVLEVDGEVWRYWLEGSNGGVGAEAHEVEVLTDDSR